MEINPQPVYEADQVITYRELAAMNEGFIYQYHATKWWHWLERLKLRAAIGCIHAQFNWIQDGKPTVRVNKGV